MPIVAKPEEFNTLDLYLKISVKRTSSSGPVHSNATAVSGKSFGVADGNLLVLPTASESQVLRRGTTAWEAGPAPEPAVDAVTTLPTAGAEYLGKFRIVRTGTGQVSKLYLCVQNSTDGYKWIQVATST